MVKPARPRKGSIIQADKGIDYSGGHADVRVFNVAYRGDGIAVSGRAHAALHVRYEIAALEISHSFLAAHILFCIASAVRCAAASSSPTTLATLTIPTTF
jgi:hypothetical protein